MESEFPNFSLNLDFENFENETASKIIFHSSILRRLLTHIVLLAGHTIERLIDFFTMTTKNITGFRTEFGYGKYVIIPFW